jgi:hypothetical protein
MGIAYNTSIAVDGLILHLDPANLRSYSGSGNTWYDLSGLNNHGYLQNSPSFSSVGVSSNFSFNGTNQYVDITTSPNTFSYNRSSFTVMGWVRFTTLPSLNYKGTILSKWNVGSGQANEFILNTSDSDRTFILGVDFDDSLAPDAATNDIAKTTTIYTTNTWYHVCGTFNNGVSSIYLNGVLEHSVTNANTTVRTDNTAYLRIGLFYTNIYSEGQRGVVQMYNRALSAAEIKTNYNAMKKRYGL